MLGRRRDRRRLLPHMRAQRLDVGPARQRLRRPIGVRRTGHQLVLELRQMRRERVPGHRLGRQAPRDGLGPVQAPPAEQQLRRAHRPQHPRQPVGHARVRRHPERGERRHQLRVLAHQHDIAAQHEPEPRPGGRPVDAGQHQQARARQRHRDLARRLAELLDHRAPLRPGGGGGHGLDVPAAAEDPSRAGQREHVHGVVRLGRGDRREHLARHRQSERVALRGPVQRQPHDAGPRLDEDGGGVVGGRRGGCGGHVSSWGWRVRCTGAGREDGRPGMGWVRDPKRAAYNAVYKRTTFSVWDLFR
ncbi:hypothetical protein MICRO116_650012 [Micrococcus sp. 116]|nr:hypothetical protein MICRO116_650012 [Micrococcus sp. 116]